MIYLNGEVEKHIMAFSIRSIRLAYSVSLAALIASLTACASGGPTTTDGGDPAPTAGAASDLSGKILVDGSSTVYPISEAMGEEFNIANPDVDLTIGFSGSGGGFKKFCAGETDILTPLVRLRIQRFSFVQMQVLILLKCRSPMTGLLS